MKNLVIIFSFFISGITIAQIPNYVPTSGLVGWWPFNGNANDESGYGNNGTVNGATLTADRNGVANSAYSFDGVNDEITASRSHFNEFSSTVWVNSSSMGCVKPILDAYNGSWELYSDCTNGYLSFIVWNNLGYTFHSSNISLDINTWYHIAIVYSNSQIKIYVNGQLITSQNTSQILPISGLLRMGASISGTPQLFSGKLDDIGFWNRALTECEIQDLYHSQVGFTTVDAGQDQSICRGAEVTLNGTGGNFLSWNNGVFNGVPFAPNQTSNYVLTGSDSLGCVGTDTVLVTVLDNASSTINQTAIDSYSLNGQTYTQSGTYTQVLTAANGCDSTITLNLELDFTGIQTNTLTSLKLYPNPVQDVLHVDGLASKEFEYEVLSIEGKLLQKGKSQGEISVKELRKGNYVLRVGQQQVSFVKQ
jgi:hypothetical protein